MTVMQLTPLQRQIVAALERFPAGFQDDAQVSWLDRSQFQLSEMVTAVLRKTRRSQPMIWDPWILKDDDLYRMFYLKGVEGQVPWWTTSHICGAVSPDLETWQDLGTLLEPNPANDWESGRVCAGCAYKENGIYYLFYSAGGKEMPHLRNEAIGLATSTDGIHFDRSDRPLLVPEPDSLWYRRSNWTNHFHWRDPYLFKDEKTGKYYLFICASENVSGHFQGCIALAVADAITGPYEILPPAIAVPPDAIETWGFYHLERPQVIYRNGQYHLFFSCFKMLSNPKWLKSLKHRKVTNSSLYWYVSDQLAGPYQPIDSENFVVEGSEKTGLYGTNFLQISAEPEEYIAYGWYHRLHALEVSKTLRFKDFARLAKY